MGDKWEKRKHSGVGSLPTFVPVYTATLDNPAWRALSHGARSLYVAIKRHWNKNHNNNGRIFLSQRDAAKELGSNRDSVARWFRELQFYGFIVMTNPGSLGVEGRGKAPHWCLTELPTNDGSGTLKAATRDFDRWDGKKFKDRPTRPKKQKAGPNCGATLAPIVGPVVDRKVGPPNSPSGPNSGAIEARVSGPESGAITSLPLCSGPVPAPVRLTASPQLIDIERRRQARAKRALQGAVASPRLIRGGQR